jgi:hypothetical protein
MVFSKSGGQAGNSFQSGPKNPNFLDGQLPLPEYTSPEKLEGGEFNILPK